MVFIDGINCEDGRWKFTGYIFSKTLSKHLSNLIDYSKNQRFEFTNLKFNREVASDFQIPAPAV